MPSEMMNMQGVSRSFLSEDVSSLEGRHVGLWKTEAMRNLYGTKSGETLNSERINPLLEKFVMESGRGSSHSLPRAFGDKSYFSGDHIMGMGAQNENGLFSSSLSEIFSRNMRLSLNNNINNNRQYEESEAEPFESLEELEAQTIGDLLPDDDDELFCGVGDGMEYNPPPPVEDEDLFFSGGGLDMGEESSNSPVEGGGGGNSPDNPTFGGEHPFGEHPSRTLFVRNINSNVDDSELQSLFEQYGDIRSLYTACKHRGFVMITYYDIRAAWNAMKALQNKALRRRKLDIHFSIPKFIYQENPSDKDINQGSVVLFNLDSSISNDELKHIFGVYGEVKEIRETTERSNDKIIEYYDVRGAEAAVNAIAGKRIKLAAAVATRSMHQFCSEMEQQQTTSPTKLMSVSQCNMENASLLGARAGLSMSPYLENTFHHGVSSSMNLTGVSKFHHHFGNTLHISKSSSNLAAAGGISGDFVEKPMVRRISSFGRQSVNVNEDVYNTQENMWSNSHSQANQGIMWGNSTFNMGGCQQHVGSAPSIWESVPTDAACVFQYGKTNSSSSSSSRYIDFIQQQQTIFPSHPHNNNNNNNNNVDLLSLPTNNLHNQRCLIRPQIIPIIPSFDPPSERNRLRRNESASDNKKHFELDLDRILLGHDNRTTLMIKNIPNKYTSKMLLTAIDDRHKGTYDFLYLPIDFKNKCNVGYAFINMTDPSSIIPFYQAFNGKKWEKFNSEKVASIAYARIQGKSALIAHFQNSSLMNEDKRCRPILFHTDGPNAGDQVPFPMGVNIRTRPPTKNRSTITNEEINQESTLISESVIKNSSFVSLRDLE